MIYYVVFYLGLTFLQKLKGRNIPQILYIMEHLALAPIILTVFSLPLYFFKCTPFGAQQKKNTHLF